MNLYDYFNPFMRWLETNYLPDKAIILYLRMLDMFNRRGWAETVGVDLPSIMSMVGTSDRKTATRARDALVTAGLIRYQKGHKGKISVYSLCELGGKKAPQNAPQNDGGGLGGKFAPQSAPENAPQSATENAPQNAPPYKTKTETGEETKEDGDDDTRTRRGQSPAVSYYLDRINPMASPLSLEAMAQFERTLGSDLCIRACNLAQDARPSNLWGYIRKLLSEWERAGVRSVAELEARERDRERRNRNGNTADGRSGGSRRSPASGETSPGGNPAEDTFQGRRLSKPIPVGDGDGAG